MCRLVRGCWTRVTHGLVPGDSRISNQFASSRFLMTSFPSLALRNAFPPPHPLLHTHDYRRSPGVSKPTSLDKLPLNPVGLKLSVGSTRHAHIAHWASTGLVTEARIVAPRRSTA
ncbi:hypothetical protein DPEC_G00286240 [Dallia pectoralis]|uniref:Uncharacterized protein n=1 Tax=Dallia pectoralis TaxID=75939 RepID=A0ACC2FK64_DALPE|nr:hypothetical protein DPEC_G00286240 [Dallia pectoralis]